MYIAERRDLEMMDITRIEESDVCFCCGSYLQWRADINNGKPEKLYGLDAFLNDDDRSEGKLVFISKNEVEVTVWCQNCNNKSKFIKKL
jgi:hypothetical protein